jgi:aminomethyltransferase
MVDFAGWEMPVQYSGVIEEHRVVRSAAGLFDLSHMGEIEVSGPGAGAALDAALVSEPSRLALGRAQYSIIVDERGGMLDDLVVYRTAVDRWLVVANASNRAVVVAALRERIGAAAAVHDLSDETAMIAIQGPRSLEILAPLVALDDASALDDLRGYAALTGRVGTAKVAALIARTGYTGEDGFEIYVAAAVAPGLWRELLAAGAPFGAQPIGLGARDTLRLEAGMPLYGNELRRELTPYDVGLGRVVRLEKSGDFIGRAALTARSTAGETAGRRLIGLRVTGRGIARHGYPVRLPGGAVIGSVTSGTHAPSVGAAIALADLAGEAGPWDRGRTVEVEVRGEWIAAEVTHVPFIQRPTRRGSH